MQPMTLTFDLAQIAVPIIVAIILAAGGACVGAIIGVRLLQVEFRSFKEFACQALEVMKKAIDELKNSRDDCGERHDGRMDTLETSIHSLERDVVGLKARYSKSMIVE